MPRQRVDWFPIILGSLFLFVILVPYILAYNAGGEAYRFGGFLLNPLDGNSYLAKMYQGWQGSWRFTLPFTVERGEGGYLFLFYLALGHLARVSGGSSHLIFHLFRIAGAAALVFSLWLFFKRVFSQERIHRLAFGLALFGSGMGWLFSTQGTLSMDFWVAEGYPLLSAYANPHFPLGTAIMLLFLAPGMLFRRMWMGVIFGIFLAILMPFGVVLCSVILAGLLVWEYVDILRVHGRSDPSSRLVKNGLFRNETGQKLIVLLAGSAPILIYQVWISSRDPVLAAWNAQNITLTPQVWELFIAYAPVLLVAIPGAYLTLKDLQPSCKVLLLWAGLGLLLLYMPWNLQRRFITGYMIPLAGLGAIALDRIFSWKRIAGLGALAIIVVLMVPTNLIVLTGGIQAVESKEESLFLSEEEFQALKWIETNTDAGAVILASPEMGLLVPAYTGRSVWYGHPFETPHAERMQARVLDFFAGINIEQTNEMLQNSDYLFYGDRERVLGELQLDQSFDLVFEAGSTRIYHIK